ncbi:hypothetical protein SAMN05421820_10489 [Pedobacter steynii]|uniref:Uncharacterized protein n=1 Tax=Pedobacter steynii TaxID=430522 RepID=A0A1G9U7V2_9SPHI|nr:hypothetical protein [Pedobacter steynii]NQX40685.1 hypothetical protein [Pedobacter steynii]SDM55948.1 hypothetical protein SAMN05421820_10489 [Pedobacter steynii]
MKKIISIILILSLGFQCMATLGLITIYQLNKAYVSSALCENRNRPEIHCEGKCVLKKSLAHAERTEREAGSVGKQLDIPLFLTVTAEDLVVEFILSCKGNTPFLLNYTHTISDHIFHPPLV